MLKRRNLGAYRDLFMLFMRYGRKDFLLSLQPQEMDVPDTEEPPEPDVRRRAEAFAKALKQMGPMYVKFGQVLSTRPDIVPPEYIAALESLQDQTEPFSFAEVEKIVEEELHVRISKAFETFESTPIAAASLGQVHRAFLRDGREVVVKVQRPNIRELVNKDLEVFTDIAHTIEQYSDLGRKMNLVASIEQARITVMNELNYVQEAHNMAVLRANLADFPQIYIPQVVADLSSSRVLTTEFVKGRKVSKLTPLSMIEHNYAELASVLTRAYLKQICVDGIWHSDPHPGNVFIRDVDDVPQIVLLDFGMVSRIGQEVQDEVIKLLLAISTNRGTDVAEACIRLSEVEEHFEPVKFVRKITTVVAALHDATARQVNAGQIIFTVIAIGNNNDLKAPPELTMLGKTLLNLDGITKKLDPDYDPEVVIRDYAQELMRLKLQQKFHPRNLYPALLDLNQLALDLPRRAIEITDLTAAGKLTFGIKVAQADEFLAGIHKVANRITVGVIIAALLIASSMMMGVPAHFQIFGYPGIAMLGWLIAAIASVYLIATTFLHDREDRERAKRKGK